MPIVTQAAALAALEDKDYIGKTLANNSEQKKWITQRLTEMGVHVYPGEGNFILFTLGHADKASACLAFLKSKGILLRGMSSYGLADCIRMTIGLPEDMQEVAKAMQEFISAGAV